MAKTIENIMQIFLQQRHIDNRFWLFRFLVWRAKFGVFALHAGLGDDFMSKDEGDKNGIGLTSDRFSLFWNDENGNLWNGARFLWDIALEL